MVDNITLMGAPSDSTDNAATIQKISGVCVLNRVPRSTCGKKEPSICEEKETSNRAMLEQTSDQYNPEEPGDMDSWIRIVG